MDNTTHVAEREATDSPISIDAAPAETLLEDELLVEEISIDGMCGVY